MKKTHLVGLDDHWPVRTACGRNEYGEIPSEFHTLNYKEVTCGLCKRTTAFFGKRNMKDTGK